MSLEGSYWGVGGFPSAFWICSPMQSVQGKCEPEALFDQFQNCQYGSHRDLLIHFLLKEAKAKLNSALETKLLNKKSVTVAQMMLETATTKRENTTKQLDKIRNKQKSLDKTTHKLLDEALHRKGEPDKKRKTTAEQRCLKKVKKWKWKVTKAYLYSYCSCLYLRFTAHIVSVVFSGCINCIDCLMSASYIFQGFLS